MTRKILLAVVGVLFFTAGCGALGYVIFKPHPAYRGEITVSGTEKTIRIYRDDFGVPHVLAKTDADAFFGLGFVQAQDRPLLLEIERLAAHGRVGEIIGRDFIEFDLLARTFDFYGTAAKQIENIRPEYVKLAKAFTDGINAGYASLGEDLPIEFRLLGLKPTPWTPTDCLAAGNFVSFGISLNYTTELLMYKISRKVGLEKARTVMPYAPPKPSGIVRLPNVETRGSLLEAAARNPGDIIPRIACNNWAVAPSRTATGKALFAYDSHQWGSHVPGEVFLVHMRGATFDVAGGAMTGLPGMYSGHNRRIAWGNTNLGGDCQDLYVEKINPDDPDQYMYKGQWRRMKKHTENICWADKKAPGGKSCEEMTIRETVHGPVVTPIVKGVEAVMSLKWSRMNPALDVTGFFDFARAKNFDEYSDALDRFELSSQNFTYADIEGNIAYQASKPIPLRSETPDGSLFPVPGWEGKYEWVRYLELDEMPHVINPENGFIATANHNPALEGFDAFLGASFMPIARHDRIVEFLNRDKKFTRRDMMDLQMDIKSLAAEKFVGTMLSDIEDMDDSRVKRAVELLGSWDFENRPDSVAATIYHAWWKFVAEETFRDELGDELATEYLGLWSLSMDRFFLMIEDPDNVWFDDVTTPEKENRKAISQRGVLKALDWLEEELGDRMDKWEWGRMHVVSLNHWFDPMVKFFNVGPVPYGGDGETVQRASFDWNNPFETSETAILRVIADFSDTDHIWAVIPSGQSGWWLQRNYSDQWPLWLTGKYLKLPLNEDEIEASCPHLLTLSPE